MADNFSSAAAVYDEVVTRAPPSAEVEATMRAAFPPPNAAFPLQRAYWLAFYEGQHRVEEAAVDLVVTGLPGAAIGARALFDHTIRHPVPTNGQHGGGAGPLRHPRT